MVSEKELYSEGCEALRHYSNCVMNLRTTTIAQGIVILSALVFLLTERQYLLAFSLSTFGLFFTIVLNTLQSNYGKHFETILKSVIALEGTFTQDNKLLTPWTNYSLPRKKRFNKKIYKSIIYFGPIIFLLLGLLSIAIYSFLKLITL